MAFGNQISFLIFKKALIDALTKEVSAPASIDTLAPRTIDGGGLKVFLVVSLGY